MGLLVIAPCKKGSGNIWKETPKGKKERNKEMCPSITFPPPEFPDTLKN